MRTVHRVNVFAAGRDGGNPAGVVLEADDLSPEDMGAIARTVGFSETAFVAAPRGPDHDVWVRFFTPIQEVPLCGHATLAVHAVRARCGGMPVGRARQAAAGGRWCVTWRLPVVTMEQGPVSWRPALTTPEVRAILRALRLEAHDLLPDAPVAALSTGHIKYIVPVRDVHTLRAMAPDRDELIRWSQRSGIDGYFVFALVTDDGDTLTEARMFAPRIGIDEDPVNGSGHGPLGAYLLRYGLLDPGRRAFWSRMGAGLGRLGRVRVEIEAVGRVASAVRVGGVVVFRDPLTIEPRTAPCQV